MFRIEGPRLLKSLEKKNFTGLPLAVFCQKACLRLQLPEFRLSQIAKLEKKKKKKEFLCFRLKVDKLSMVIYQSKVQFDRYVSLWLIILLSLLGKCGLSGKQKSFKTQGPGSELIKEVWMAQGLKPLNQSPELCQLCSLG